MKRGRIWVLALVAVLLSACALPVRNVPAPAAPVVKPAAEQQPSAPQPAASSQAAAQQTTTAPPEAIQGKMSLAPKQGPVGTRVVVTGTDLPANATLNLVWGTMEGTWLLKGAQNEEYHGQKYTPKSAILGKVTTDARGNLETSFTVPEDYGFLHDVQLIQDGVIRNKTIFSLDPTFKISPTSGPPGTPITIEATGLGWKTMEGSWNVLWDNRHTGWLSTVTTKGTAKAVIPAAGKPGKHILEIYANPLSTAYRAPEVSPLPYLKPVSFEFTITDDKAMMPPDPKEQALPIERGVAPGGTGTAIWADPWFAPVGTPVTLHGRALPPGKTVEIVWYRVVGNRVSGSGWSDTSEVLTQVKVDSQGALHYNFPVPDELGGAHKMEARIDGQVVASTSLTITPSAKLIGPTSGPVGTEFVVELKGVGWTETANIYLMNYDNATIGYVCGFFTQGKLPVKIKATGEPGWHYIDFYPGIYKGQESMGISMFRVPQLTYAADHPGERLPAFRFAFYVTE